MDKRTVAGRGVSCVSLLALALLLASCKLPGSDKTYTVGGTVSGLTGSGLVLQNNGGNNLAVPANGAFAFSSSLKKDASYSVTVLTQPSGQSCTVAHGTGKVTANVTDVVVACVANALTVGGTVSGLTGTGLVLQNNGSNNLAISANGPFTFSTALANGATYNVEVFTQPSGQSCTVANGAGAISANVTNVAVNCVSTAFTVGGAVSGLTGAGLVLQNNGGNNLAISANGGFTFSVALANAATYNVTVLTPPSGQGCAVANGSGSIAGANVTNITVACAVPPAAPTLSIGFGLKELQFTWPPVSGATFYRLRESADGGPTFVQVATNIIATSYNYTIPVHRRVNASYILDACNNGGCTASFAQSLGTNLAQAIGYVKASNTGAGDQFGFSVALSADGNTLAVGTPDEDSSSTGINSSPNESAAQAGAVYVYTRGAGGWIQQAYVKASNTGKGDTFGASVALSGDGNTLAVGASIEGSAATGIGGNQTYNCTAGNPIVNCAAASGAVYVYTRTAGAWSQQAYVKASNAGATDHFGTSVSLSGDGNTLAVGAPLESGALTGVTSGSVDETAAGNDAFFAGAVYVYIRSAGTWSQQAYVKASNTEIADLFGTAVALSGDGNTLAVGAVFEDSALTGVTPGSVNEGISGNDSSNSGAVYVFTRGAGTWSQQAYVKASNTGDGDNFGNSVSLSSDGNTLAVGAPFEDGGATGVGGTTDEAAADAGAVYVYTRSAGTWSPAVYVKASNTGGNDQFGTSVALSGDGNSLAVGAFLEDGALTGVASGAVDEAASGNGANDSGAVYFYARVGGTWSQQAYVKASNTGDVDRFGVSVALSGDGNALAVGAHLEDGGAMGIGGTQDDSLGDSGAVYLY